VNTDDQRLNLVTATERLSREIGGANRVVFDLDGTIYDTRDFERPALESVVNWLREKSGRSLDGLTVELWLRRETDRHRSGLFDDVLHKFDLPLAWGAECAQRFHDHSPSGLTSEYSLREYLLELRARGLRLALVSNGRDRLQQRKCDAIGLRGLFDECIICGPDFPERQKPGSWAWSQLANWRAGLPTVYVGDDPVDEVFAAAGRAGFVKFRFRSPKYAD